MSKRATPVGKGSASKAKKAASGTNPWDVVVDVEGMSTVRTEGSLQRVEVEEHPKGQPFDDFTAFNTACRRIGISVIGRIVFVVRRTTKGGGQYVTGCLADFEGTLIKLNIDLTSINSDVELIAVDTLFSSIGKVVHIFGLTLSASPLDHAFDSVWFDVQKQLTTTQKTSARMVVKTIDETKAAKQWGFVPPTVTKKDFMGGSDFRLFVGLIVAGVAKASSHRYTVKTAFAKVSVVVWNATPDGEAVYDHVIEAMAACIGRVCLFHNFKWTDVVSSFTAMRFAQFTAQALSVVQPVPDVVRHLLAPSGCFAWSDVEYPRAEEEEPEVAEPSQYDGMYVN